MPSLFERSKERKAEKLRQEKLQQQLDEQERQRLAKKIQDAIHTTNVQRELYKMRIQDAVAKARRAVKNNDVTGKAIAMQELKMCYGVYRYMGTLNSAYRTMDAQIQMQNITQNFAGVVNSLSEINYRAPKLDFKEMTAKALTGLKGLDLTGMEDMVNQLVQGTNVATAVEVTDDPFLEQLISGEATLDSAPAEMAAAPVAVPVQTQAAAPVKSQSQDDLIESMLAQLSEGLSNA